MNRPLFVLLATFLVAHPLKADEVSVCTHALASFAGAEEDTTALVTTTYRRFLRELGGNQFSNDTIDAIAASGDPFVIPDQAGSDFFMLQKRLREFHELVRAKGWDNEPVRRALLAELGTLRAEHVVATESIEHATANSFVDYPLGFPDGASTTTSPDGRWIVGIEGKGSLVSEYYVHDRTTRQTRMISMTQVPVGAPTFSADGTELIFPNHTAQMMRVPFDPAKGEADFTKSVTLGQALGTMHSLQLIRHAKTPGQFFAGRRVELFDGQTTGDGDPKIQRFDLNTNERLTVNLREQFGNVRISGWGVIPGTDELWVLVHVPEAATGGPTGTTMPAWRVHTFTVASNGSVKQSRMPRTWFGSPIRGLWWQPDGKTCLVLDDQGISLWDEHRKPQAIYPRFVVPGDNGFVQASAPDPSANRVAFLFRPRSGPARIEWVNMDTRAVEDGFELSEPPQFRAIKFLADGKGMLMLDSAGHWVVVNHLAR